MNLSTKYLGIDLKNPVIAGASKLTSELDSIKRLEDAGAAAVVTKSLFEEQIQLERLNLDDQARDADYRHPEMINVFVDEEIEAGPDAHLSWVKSVKDAVSIPVIGSLNAVHHDTWIEYAQKMAQTGVDALELNMYASPRDMETNGSAIEKEQLAILKEIKEKVSIPVSVKLSLFYSNPLNMIASADKTGVDGFVLFNRLFQPSINVDKEAHTFPFNLSTPNDNAVPLRFAGLLYGNVSGSICASTGIFHGKDVAKMLLAGASCVQVVSTLYKNQIGHVRTMLSELESWMEVKGYGSVSDFAGKLSKENSDDPWVYTRAQYASLLLRPNPFAPQQPGGPAASDIGR